jgi:predicted site-specific integrase-resolvase
MRADDMGGKDHVSGGFLSVDGEEILSSRQALQYLGLESLGYLHNLTSAGAIPVARKGNGRLIFKRADLDSYIAARRRDSVAVAA